MVTSGELNETNAPIATQINSFNVQGDRLGVIKYRENRGGCGVPITNYGNFLEQMVHGVGMTQVHCCCMLARALVYACVYFFDTLNLPQTDHAPLSSLPPATVGVEAEAVGFSLSVMRS